ncbi:MAG TPA: tolB protein [Polyangiaceae bacterium]|nr:tolB protein [Polyangiaceae bacterium]
MRLASLLVVLFFFPCTALAQGATAPPQDETQLGEIPVTGSSAEHVVKLAILPSLAADMEDVVVRGVVRHDFELSGLFEVIPDGKAPPGLYGFEDAVDVPAWRNVGAEVVVKVAARKKSPTVIDVLGIAYLLNVGKDPVYQKTISVAPDQVRVTAHRVTDLLLGALTGRAGGFASHMTYSAAWGKSRRILTMDADGHDLAPQSSDGDTAIAPTWGPNGILYFSLSHDYAPFVLMRGSGSAAAKVDVPFKSSVYSAAFDKDNRRMALAVDQNLGSAVYTGNADGTGVQKVSTTEIATHPVWSPSGKLAWVGGGAKNGGQRIYVDGKAVSPSGFAASSPTFCDTEDGIRLVFTVSVGGDRQDLVMTNEKGGGTTRLTQNQGTNTYPACSSDGRLLAFFSTRKSGAGPGLYIMSLKRWTSQRLSSQLGESLRWAPLPP